MKKITSAQRIADIFSTESLEVCRVLLDVAEGIVKSRHGVEGPAKRRTTKRVPEVANESQ